jgi:hypothetical protein
MVQDVCCPLATSSGPPKLILESRAPRKGSGHTLEDSVKEFQID